MSDNNCCNVELTLSESPIVELDALGSSYIGELPTMSTVQKGGAKVGAGLEVDSDEFLNIAPSGVVSSMIDNAAITTEKLADGAVTADKIDPDVLENLGATIAYSGSGESVTADNASYLASLSVDGKAVQNGTPTPSSPIPVKVVESRNLLNPKLYSGGGYNPTVGTQWTLTDSPIQFTADSDKTVYSLNTSSTWQAYTLILDITGYDSGELWLKTTFNSTGTAGISRGYLDSSYNVLTVSNNTSASYAIDESLTGKPSNAAYYYIVITNRGTASTTLSLTTPLVCEGDAAIEYIPYGSIGLNVNNVITPIDLQGNVLASLPDGTKDVLTVDSVGHCVATINAKKLVFNGSATPTLSSSSSTLDNWKIGTGTGTRDWKYNDNNSLSSENTIYNSYPVASKGFAYATGPGVSILADGFYVRATKGQFADGAALQSYLQANPVEVWYQLATPQTIDLGYIDMPAIPDGSTISITAQVTPAIAASWWARGAAAIGEALQAVCARFQAVEAAIAELATA